ncbi:MAG: DUF6663 family protein [Halolamina sp.]
MTDSYRVLGRPPGADGLLLAPRTPTSPEAGPDPDAVTPVAVDAPPGEGDAVATVDGTDLYPGYVVSAALDGKRGDRGDTDDEPTRPTVADVAVERETLLTVAEAVEGLYEAATDAFRTARAAGEGMTSRVTRGTDGDPNGALYVFADPPGENLLTGFRRGRPPIDPLLARADEGRDGDGPMEAFVLESAADPFVAVHVVFEREGVLANTIRETYNLPRPDAAGGLAGRLDADAGADSAAEVDADDDFDLLDGDLPKRE